MIPALRKAFNEAFSQSQYEAFLADLNHLHPGAIEFRIAETPIFVPLAFNRKMIDTCEQIVDLIIEPGFISLTDRSIPAADFVPGKSANTHFIAFDFGVCLNLNGELEPQLIEMQGFPTLFGFQVYYPELLRKYFPIPVNFSHYLGNYKKESYLAELKAVILGATPVENTILLELKPHEQKTRIDFYCTQDYLGIQPVCIRDLLQEGKKIFYTHAATGRKTQVLRIYNRIIFDDMHAQKESLGGIVDIRQDLDVTWIPHPNWFYRISKYTLPYLHHPYVPKTYFLDQVKSLPVDLEHYVLKPLYSFAGQGVVIDVQRSDIEKVSDPQNWILQQKVTYADVIETPDGGAKAEFRIMYMWKDGEPRPRPAINLARLSKGKMIGVRYNQDKSWVGGSVCYIER